MVRKKKYPWILASAIAFIHLFPGASKGNDREKMNLSGKVKSVIWFDYEAKDVTGKIIKGTPEKNTSDDYNYSMFNVSGRLTQQQSYAKEDSLLRRKIYKYNAKDSLVELTILG